MYFLFKDAAAYACAVSKDQQFISTYSRENSYTEDVAESVLVWYGARVRPDRVDEATRNLIEATIPNRLDYFDKFQAVH
jgi:hypothetical protein